MELDSSKGLFKGGTLLGFRRGFDRDRDASRVEKSAENNFT